VLGAVPLGEQLMAAFTVIGQLSIHINHVLVLFVAFFTCLHFCLHGLHTVTDYICIYLVMDTVAVMTRADKFVDLNIVLYFNLFLSDLVIEDMCKKVITIIWTF